MTTYYTYNPATKRLVRAPDPAIIDGQMVVHPSAAMYARIGAYPGRATTPPTPPEGKVAVPDGYALDGGEWVQQWKFEDAPPPPPRRWTPLAVKRACGERWPAVKAALEAAGIFEDFLMAQELREDDPAFMQGVAWAKSEYGDAAVDAVLDAAEKLS